MGYEEDDLGKVCRLYNGGEYGDSEYIIACYTFGHSPGVTDATLHTEYILLKPQECIELTCFELPKTYGDNTFQDYIGSWRITGRWGTDLFKNSDAIGRFPRVLAIGRVYVYSGTAYITGTYYNNQALSDVFTVTNVNTTTFLLTKKSGSLPNNYSVQLTPILQSYAYLDYNNSNTTQIQVKVASKTTNSSGFNFIIFAPQWQYDFGDKEI